MARTGGTPLLVVVVHIVPRRSDDIARAQSTTQCERTLVLARQAEFVDDVA